MQSLNVSTGVPGTKGPSGPRTFQEVIQYFEEKNFNISGVTRNSSGAALANCTVKLFNQATNQLEQSGVSDASGNYSFTVDKAAVWLVLAYLSGSPDVAGTTVNTLAGA